MWRCMCDRGRKSGERTKKWPFFAEEEVTPHTLQLYNPNNFDAPTSNRRKRLDSLVYGDH